jgi:DNA invertase Pin-like site-specific DNA recombinase
MINMLTSFAQFEREQSGERTREKISAACTDCRATVLSLPLKRRS